MARRADPERLSNPKREAFCQEFLVDLNATAAAARAGYSAKSSHAQGCRLMGMEEVQRRVQQLMERRVERTEITQDRVIAELALLAFSDMRAFADWGQTGVTLKTSAELTADAARCVAEIGETTGKTRSVRFKLHDKVGPLIKLGQHLGIRFAEQHELTGKDGGPIEHRTTQVWEIGGRRIEF
jgi:phage terminase small subunit